MDAYIYQADIYCESCGKAIRAKLDAEGRTPANVSDERTFDSDDYPKGPYSDGGGESDIPQHCGNYLACGVFLENPLTHDGEQYVRQAINVDHANIKEWREYYAYLFT
jgi:hypothetical protein